MAVKPRNKMDNSGQNGLDPQKLAHFLNMFQHPEIYLPTSNDVINCCRDVALWLGSISAPEGENNSEEYMAFLNEVQLTIGEYLSTANPKLRKEVISAIRNVIYPMIINQTGSPMKGICVMLNILQKEAVEWMVEEGDSAGMQGTNNLKNMMHSLFRWLYAFDILPVNSAIVLMFIKKLEDKQRWDVLMDVSLQEITKLFEALLGPREIRESVAPVLFHILGAMRQHPLIIDKIARHVEYVLENLAWDSSQHSRQLLQTVVDMTAMLINEQEPQKKDKYSHIVAVLDAHMTSNSCHYLLVEPWKEMPQPGVGGAGLPRPKSGLRNQGNMCYFNSVMQALLLNKTFTRHVIMRMHNLPVWSTVCKLFTRMLYSSGQSLDVREFYKSLKPHHFTDGHQHDCSEFLMHLMNSLSAVEMQVKTTTKPIEPSPGQQGDQGSSTSELAATSVDETAQSSSSGAQKRPYSDHMGGMSPKRKLARTDSDSFIQATFGGISVTNVTCLCCGSDSRRQDTFREIQLAIPEKQDLVKDEYTVQFLFNYYCKTEMLTGDNAYRCSSCNQLTDAEKSIHLKKTPKYLLIVLKRFNYDPKMQEHTKLMHRVSLNRVLCVGPTVGTPPEKSTYKLYATVIHAGIHVDMGHYYTFAEENGQWYRYNDELVEHVEEKELLRLNHASETPYLLFYRRADLEEEAQPDISELPESVLAHVHTYDKQQTNRHRHATRSSTGHAPIRPVYT